MAAPPVMIFVQSTTSGRRRHTSRLVSSDQVLGLAGDWFWRGVPTRRLPGDAGLLRF